MKPLTSRLPAFIQGALLIVILVAAATFPACAEEINRFNRGHWQDRERDNGHDEHEEWEHHHHLDQSYVNCPAGLTRVFSQDGRQTACANVVSAFAPPVGIGTTKPMGSLDIESDDQTATLCLNGKCVNSLGGNVSLQPNGYQVLPSGLILQWGSYTLNLLPATDNPVREGWGDSWTGVPYLNNGPINFPMQFPNAVFSLTMTPQDVLGYGCQEQAWYSGLTKTGFNPAVALKDGQGGQCTNITSMTATWFAIGY